MMSTSNSHNEPAFGSSPGGTTATPLEAMLAEYASLREESLQSIGHLILIMNFTFGALSIIVAGLLNSRASNILSGIIALFFVPQLAKAGLLIWLGEYNRAQRAGRWIKTLESRINDHLGSESAMGWENALTGRGKGKSTHMAYPYVAVVLLVLGVGYTSSFLGAYFLIGQLVKVAEGRVVFFFSVILVVIYVLSVETLYFRFFLRKWREVRTA
jgi:hypothetical protein